MKGIGISRHLLLRLLKKNLDLDNITVSYGHNVGPLDPYTNPYMFANQEYIENSKRILDYFYAIANPPTYPRKYPPEKREKRELFGFVPEIYVMVIREIRS